VIIHKRCLIWLLLLTLAGTSVSFGASSDEVQTKIDQTKKKLSETKRRENSVLGTLFQTQRELERISTNLAGLNNKLSSTEQRMNAITAQIKIAQTELDQLKTQIGGHRSILDQRLIAFYKYGYQSSLEILFTAQNFAEFVTRFEMIRRFTQVDVRALKTLQTQQDLITQKKQEIVQKQQELASQKSLFLQLQNQNKREQTRQISLSENKQKELASLQNDRKALEQALDELEQTSKELEAQIRQYQNQSHTALGTGKYIWPVPGDVIQYFGWRTHPILRKRKFHTGIDIVAPQGTTISAADSGVVIFCGRNGGYGKMILLDHGSGFATLYAHCSMLMVDMGQAVTKGQEIAKVGTTGLSTGPHLHFEIRKEGVPTNPLSSL
jgi:murein DD-endopeptidase MepM/ murein hydrolase activator NlpD